MYSTPHTRSPTSVRRSRTDPQLTRTFPARQRQQGRAEGFHERSFEGFEDIDDVDDFELRKFERRSDMLLSPEKKRPMEKCSKCSQYLSYANKTMSENKELQKRCDMFKAELEHQKAKWETEKMIMEKKRHDLRKELAHTAKLLEDEAESYGVQMRELNSAREKAEAECRKTHIDLEETKRMYEQKLEEMRQVQASIENSSHNEIERLRQDLSSSEEMCKELRKTFEESKAEIGALQAQHELSIAELKRSHENGRSNGDSYSGQARRDEGEIEIEQALAAQQAQLRAEFEDQLHEERLKFDSDLKAAIEETRIKLEEDHQTALQNERAIAERTLHDLAEEHRQSLDALVKSHTSALSALSSDHEASLRALEQNNQEMIQSLNEKLAQEQIRHREAVQALQLSHEQAISDMSARHEQALKDIQAESERATEKLQSDYFTATNKLDEKERELEDSRAVVKTAREDMEVLSEQYTQAVYNKSTQEAARNTRRAWLYMLSFPLMFLVPVVVLVWRPRAHYTPTQELYIALRDIALSSLGASIPAPLS